MNSVDAKQLGFTYVGLLILVAVMGVALAGTAEIVSTAEQREREAELLFVGTQYAEAISSYRAATPGVEAFPQKLEDLLEDKRTPVLKRHLRQLYRDPMTHSSKWGIERGPNNGIVAVFSLSERIPFKQAGFPPQFESFTGALTYAQWRFVGVAKGQSEPAAAPTDTPNNNNLLNQPPKSISGG